MDPLIQDEINEPVFTRYSPRPEVGTEVTEQLGFADSLERRAHNCFDEAEDSQRGLSIRLDPPAEVLETFLLNNEKPGLG